MKQKLESRQVREYRKQRLSVIPVTKACFLRAIQKTRSNLRGHMRPPGPQRTTASFTLGSG